jgi:hypothetical protein
MAVVDASSAIVIRRPRDEVAGYASEPGNAPEWYANIQSVEWITRPPVRIGTQVAFVAHFLGRRLSYTYEVAELEAGRRMVMRTADGPFPMETTYEWSDVDGGGTRMMLRNRGTPSGFSRLLWPFMQLAVRRANQKDLLRLKEVLEKRG